MKTTAFILIALMALPAANAQTLNLDVQNSTIQWTGRKVAGNHYGNISFESGSLIQRDNSYSGGEFVVDMQSLTVEDIKDARTNAQLAGHLRSDDFFGVDTYPKSRLVIRSAKQTTGNNFEFSGNLTIKDQTHPITFQAERAISGGATRFTGTIIVDRSKFNVRYGSGSFFSNLGDNLIYDNFDLKFDVTFK